MKKEYTILVTSRSGSREYTGTLDYLIDKVFGYTLECNGMGTTFNRPKSITTLVNRLNGGLSYWSQNSTYEYVKD